MLSVYNGQVIPVRDIPLLPVSEFRRSVLDDVRVGGRMVSLFGRPEGDGIRLYVLLAHDSEGRIGMISADVGHGCPSLTSECPQAHLFEREIAEECDILP